MKLKDFVLGCALVLSFIGCVSNRERLEEEKAKYRADAKAVAEARAEENRQQRQKYLNANPNVKPAIADAIRSGDTIVRGMTEQEFLLVMPKPDTVNVSAGSFGRHEQWVYKYRDEYYYFREWRSRQLAIPQPQMIRQRRG